VLAVRAKTNTIATTITYTRTPTSMNYDGAEGLEFGGGNTKVDPSVAASQL
jgi:hypothetical protein